MTTIERCVLIALVACAAAACGSSPAEPTPSTTTTTTTVPRTTTTTTTTTSTPVTTTTTTTLPPGPLTQFGAGQFLVGSQIAAGRYYTNPIGDSCYWERQSGLGGTFAEIIANEFTSFDSPQVIVDILSSDRAFESSSCGTWFNTPRHGAQASIVPGRWLVGAQVAAGTYRANALSGCYWERTRDFTRNFSAIIANNFTNSAGQQLVTISASDVGFYASLECGTWTRIAALLSPSTRQDPGDIQSNREQYRRRAGGPALR